MKKFILAGAILLSNLGCSDPSTPPNPSRSNSFNPFSLNGADVTAWLAVSVTDNDIWWYWNTSKSQVRYTTDTNYTIAEAIFLNGDQVDPGIVAFDSHGMFNNGHNYFYRQPVTISLDGASHTWEVNGSGVFPGFSDSLAAPTEKARITSPSVYDEVSASTGFTINWQPVNTDYPVYVVIQGDDSSSTFYYAQMTTDNGSFTVPASVLNGYPPQKLSLTLNRGSYKIGTLSNGKRYLLTIYSQHNVDVRLVQ